uniref:Uncharacterized protein n=1 Tax=Lepeophtheirus salmonis TaxID=72036 RepID=A0A0K2TZ67_LEPSM
MKNFFVRGYLVFIAFFIAQALGSDTSMDEKKDICLQKVRRLFGSITELEVELLCQIVININANDTKLYEHKTQKNEIVASANNIKYKDIVYFEDGETERKRSINNFLQKIPKSYLKELLMNGRQYYV